MKHLLDYKESRHSKAEYVLGIDVARFGKDETAFVVLMKHKFNEDVKLVYMETISASALTQVIGQTKILDSVFKFNKIIIDETGLGSGVTDVLREQLGGKIEGITFSMKSKEDIFNNLRLLMQQGKLKIPNDRKLIYQLLSIQFEPTMSGHYKIFHQDNTYDDLVCALALACNYFRVGRYSKRGRYHIKGYKH